MALSRRELLISAAVLAGCSVRESRVRSIPSHDWTYTQSLRPSDTAALTSILGHLDTSSLMVVHRNEVHFTYGDITECSYLASARKSVISMLYGVAIKRGDIDPDATLESIKFDDDPALLPIEKTARIRDLLSARSGVYHKAANLGDASDRAPARGAIAPGTYFLYNNWDFNALGAIYERLTGQTVYEGFELDLAQPLGLQDWDKRLQQARNDTGASRHPAHHFVLSTRDMARLGLLMLRVGRWGNRQVLTDDWVRESTALITGANEVSRTSPFVDGLGYGYLWWIFDTAQQWSLDYQRGFTATGAHGQFITILPQHDLVVVHKTVAPSPRNVRPNTYFDSILPAVLKLV